VTGRKPSERVPQTHLDGARTTLFGALRRSDAAEVGGFERGRRIPGAWIHRHNRLLYGHPTTLPSPANVAIKATSVAEPTASATTTLTVSALPNITSLSPNPITTATYTLTVTGVGFRNGAVIKVLGANVPTTWLSSTQVRGTGTFSSSNSSVPVVVTNPDGIASNTAYVSVQLPVAPPPPSGVTIVISPTTFTIKVLGTKQFTATVSGSTNKAVVWRVNGVVGGNKYVGTITTAGLYTAPTWVQSTGLVTR